MSPDVNRPEFRAVSWDEMVTAYKEQARALLDGGVDLLLPETTFDTANLKAALFAISELWEEGYERKPVVASLTITDASGRTLSGQTLEAALLSISHANLFAISLNCALGAQEMRPYIAELARLAPCFVSVYPNAGLPNAFGEYDDTPENMARICGEWARAGWLNILGGCCGTTPAQSRLGESGGRREAARSCGTVATRAVLRFGSAHHSARIEFQMVGERTNVTGSPKFSRLVKEEKWTEALEIARQQVDNGANIIDINFDEGLLDGPQTMRFFLNLLAAEPDISRVPVMVDSSKWEVLEAGLQSIQGKGIVNSLSMKEGEDKFREQARLVRRYGAGAVVMAFDEQGQADSYERRIEICERAYRILVDEVGFPAARYYFRSQRADCRDGFGGTRQLRARFHSRDQMD
jgi:5-methyltetrahydrofolate--homocysteine methyltransferase